MKTVKKVWGQEEWVVNNDKYCGKILTVKKGFRCSLHYHKKKHETFYVLEGNLLMEVYSNHRDRAFFYDTVAEQEMFLRLFQEHYTVFLLLMRK